MLQLNQGGVRSLCDEPDLDLGTHRGVRLPPAVEVPADHETLRRFPHQHPSHIGFRAGLAQLLPTPPPAPPPPRPPPPPPSRGVGWGAPPAPGRAVERPRGR